MSFELDEITGSITLRTGARLTVRKTGTTEGTRLSISLDKVSSTCTDEELGRIADMIGRVRMA